MNAHTTGQGARRDAASTVGAATPGACWLREPDGDDVNTIQEEHPVKPHTRAEVLDVRRDYNIHVVSRAQSGDLGIKRSECVKILNVNESIARELA